MKRKLYGIKTKYSHLAPNNKMEEDCYLDDKYRTCFKYIRRTEVEYYKD